MVSQFPPGAFNVIVLCYEYVTLQKALLAVVKEKRVLFLKELRWVRPLAPVVIPRQGAAFFGGESAPRGRP